MNVGARTEARAHELAAAEGIGFPTEPTSALDYGPPERGTPEELPSDRRTVVDSVVAVIPLFGIVALVFAGFQAAKVMRQDMGTERMKEIGSYIQEGAMAFLRREYSVLAIFAGIVAVLLFIANYSAGQQLIALSFIHEANTAPTAPHSWSFGSCGNRLPVFFSTAFL